VPLIIPPAVNYPSPLTAIPSFMQDQPKEGRMQVPVEILWGVMGGASKTVSINLQNNAALNISQISTLKVDNSQSGGDVVFIFPDTSDTVTIPAGAPLAVVPVFSNSVQFFVSAPNATAADVTRFQILNYQTFPADVPATVEAQTASSGGTLVNGGGPVSIQLAPAGINGTLETLKLSISVPNAPAANTQTAITVKDGNNNVFINGWNFALPSGATSPVLPLIDFNAANWRFANGLIMQFAAGGGAGSFIANTFVDYHTP
jgi:hypothetical protein